VGTSARQTRCGVITLLLLGLSVLVGLTVRAQQTPTPTPDFVDAVWVAKADGLLKLAVPDGTALLTIPDGQGVRALALDEQRGLLWVHSPNSLRAYSDQGVALASPHVPMKCPSTMCSATPCITSTTVTNA